MALEDNEKEMSLFEHLEELRNTLFYILLGLGLGSIGCFFFSEELLSLFMTRAPKGVEFIVISPTEGFFTRLKLGILGGFIVTMPFSLYQVWRFVSPGLNRKEVRLLYQVTPVLCALFLVGTALAFFVVIPLGLEFLLSFQIADVQSSLSIEKYISFCITLILLLGGTFELPVLLLLLFFVGLLESHTLRRIRKHVIVGSFFISALLTPPDVVTQIMVGIPIIGLYEISIFFMSFFERRKREPEEDTEPL
ncbi:twin-arginine translocase subunit TatC [bacterium]|jgi:sec-independent protein translocase protein TatC|nr:twin-arginine translocase subunit TatC [bacterium]